VFLENVARHLNVGFDLVARELQGMGYTVATLVCRAATVGAPHQRERLFALGVSNAGRECLRDIAERIQLNATEHRDAQPRNVGDEAVGDSDSGLDQPSPWPPGPANAGAWSNVPEILWPSAQPEVRGVVDGLPDGLGFRRAQLHALGNAVVPVQAAYAFATLVIALDEEINHAEE
jgi:DNA (cytosine-5)-methyltransferase 1